MCVSACKSAVVGRVSARLSRRKADGVGGQASSESETGSERGREVTAVSSSETGVGGSSYVRPLRSKFGVSRSQKKLVQASVRSANAPLTNRKVKVAGSFVFRNRHRLVSERSTY